MDKKNRWFYIPLAIILFVCLGTVYSWSVFRGPLEDLFNISATESGLPYMTFLAFYALFMPITGPFIDKYKPRTIIAIGGLLVGSGWILASFTSNIVLLTLTYGVIAGSGVGIIYGVPVAVISKWFYDRKGLAVGLILSGFGVSPLVTAPIAEYIITQVGVLQTFRILGIAFLIITVTLSVPFKFPSDEYKMDTTLKQINKETVVNITTKEMFKEKRFYGLWVCYVLGSLIGLMSVGITSSVGIEIANLNGKTTAMLVSVFAIFNGVGRPIFGWLTDKISPMKAAILSYGMIIVASLAMLIGGQGNSIIYIISFSIIWMTLGSWLAIAPTATGIFFGQKFHSRNYGIIFTAYGVGAVLGVSLSGYFRDVYGSHMYTFYPMIAIAILGIIISIIFLNNKKKENV
ncbi:MAG: L-lactate MFS transporter [Clostridium sp.]